MAIGKISGKMLQNDLERDGSNLSFDSNLIYLDVGLRRVGINTTSPSYDLDVNATVNANAYIGKSFTSTGNISAANVNATNMYGTVIGTLIGTAGNITGGSTHAIVYQSATNVTAFSNPASTSYDPNTATLTSTLLGGTLTTNSQPNITSVGNLSNLTVTDTITTEHLVVNGGTIANVSIGNITFNDTTLGTNSSDANIILQPTGTGLVVINTTTALQLPIGNTSQEPLNAGEGSIRYNIDTESIEFFTGNSWVSTTSTITTQSISPSGITNTFTLDKSAVTEGVIVNLNGVMQQPYTAYTITGNQITFTQTPLTTDIIEIRFITAGVAAQSTGSLALISNVAPAHSNSSGTKGQVAYDGSYMYVCVATNTWIRGAISTSF